MQCTNGHDNPDDQKFCGKCGALLPPAPPPAADTAAVATATEPAPRRRTRLWVALVAVAAAIVVIVAIATADSDTNDAARKASGQIHSSVVNNHTTYTTPTTAAPVHDVKITGNGFTQLPPDSIGNSYLSYGVVVQNPSDDIATRVSLNVAFYNDAGVVVKADSPTIDVILPGQTAAYGDAVQAAGATRMEVQALFVPAGGQAAVEISGFNDLPAPAATEMYAELSNLSLLGT